MKLKVGSGVKFERMPNCYGKIDDFSPRRSKQGRQTDRQTEGKTKEDDIKGKVQLKAGQAPPATVASSADLLTPHRIFLFYNFQIPPFPLFFFVIFSSSPKEIYSFFYVSLFNLLLPGIFQFKRHSAVFPEGSGEKFLRKANWS